MAGGSQGSAVEKRAKQRTQRREGQKAPAQKRKHEPSQRPQAKASTIAVKHVNAGDSGSDIQVSITLKGQGCLYNWACTTGLWRMGHWGQCSLFTVWPPSSQEPSFFGCFLKSVLMCKSCRGAQMFQMLETRAIEKPTELKPTSQMHTKMQIGPVIIYISYMCFIGFLRRSCTSLLPQTVGAIITTSHVSCASCVEAILLFSQASSQSGIVN